MEGASGRIEATSDPNKVKKIVYTHKSAQKKTSSLRAPAQASMQGRMRKLIKDFKLLFVPEVYEVTNTTYIMRRVDVESPIDMMSVKENTALLSEIEIFFELCRREGIYPADFELYQQSDGRVALLDFDKFATWNKDGSIKFPWGQEMNRETVDVNLQWLGLNTKRIYQ